MFKLTDSLITGKDRYNLEATIVEFNDIFARQRLDIGMNTQFKVSSTPKDDKPVYTQSLPVLINLSLDLGLMHKDGIITTLPFAKYKRCKLYLGPTEAQQQAETTGGSAQDQRTHRR